MGKRSDALFAQLHAALAAKNAANRQLQAELRRTKEMETMRQQFLFAVSHELKTPLAIIQGYAEGLESLTIDEETQRRYCRIIQSEARKMGIFVKDLLDVSRLEMGTLQLQPVLFDFSALIDEMKERFSRIIVQKELCITWEIPKDILIFGDPARIDVILTNLISNAVDYTPQGRKIRISILPKEGGYCIRVYNQGIRIPEKEQTLIWNAFYKGSSGQPTDRTFGGHGLGLGIVSSLVTLHGEAYGVYNEADGVTFWFTVSDREKELPVKNE